MFKKIYIEITNVCNLACSFCPKTRREPEFMPLNVFRQILEEVEPLTQEIALHVMGEPLLHPQIDEMIKYTEKYDIQINLTTNGTLVAEHSSALLSRAIRRINFSLHGLKANYNEEDQERHLKNIINFTKLAQEKRGDLLIIYRLWDLDKDSNAQMLKVIDSEFETCIATESRKISTKIRDNCFIHCDQSFEWPSMGNKIRSEKGYCHGLSTHFGILVNGTVVPCCLDNDGTVALGNINDDTLIDILKGERAVTIKKGFMNRALVEDLCKRCTYIKRFEKDCD